MWRNVVLVFLGLGGEELFRPYTLGQIGYAGFAEIGKKWSFRLCSNFGGEQNGLEEIKRKFTRYIFTIGSWDHGAAEIVSRARVRIGEVIDALFLPVYKGNFCFLARHFLNA